MKAHQNVAIYCVYPKNTLNKRMKDHKKRLKEAKPVILPLPEPKFSPRAQSPSKITDEIKPGTQAYVAKHNLILAKRIFEIMEGPGIISNLMENSTAENHPGTINFPYRLANAKRIHQENLAIASRLDSVKAYYDSKTIAAIAKQRRNLSPKRIKFTKRDKSLEDSQSLFDQHGRVVLGKNALHISQPSHYSTEDSGPKRARNVLLEYTKIQRGRVLDVAVIKEPFRDNYCIFGIDIDNGQRYELKLSSEEVSNILEGDILVTSVDNVEVWMTLLTKVELQPVEAFAKIPLPAPPQRSNNQNHSPAMESIPLDLEDEAYHARLYQNTETPELRSPRKVTSSTHEPQTDSPKSQTTKQYSSNNKSGSNDSLQTINSDADGGKRGHNDSASVLAPGDFDDNRYTLDQYYDSNINLASLPVSNSADNIKKATSDPFGEVVKDPYYGQFDDNVLHRPSARSATRGVSHEPDGAMRAKLEAQLAPQIAEKTITTIMNSVFRELQQKVKVIESKKSPRSNKSSADPTPPPKKSITTTNPAEQKKRLSVNNPYRSTKVSTAGRSHSIRYTPVDTPNGAANNQTTATPAAPPLQPVPPTEIQSTKQQSNVRKQTIANASTSQKQAAPSTAVKGPVAPVKPQEGVPSTRRPSKSKQTTAGSKPDNNPRKPSHTAAKLHIDECRTLAHTTAISIIESAQKNLSKILEIQIK